MPPEDTNELLRQVEALQAQVDALRTELARSEELAALGTIGAMVAHEVNNLMTPIITYAQMAQSHPEDAALVGRALERSVAGAHQAAKTAESILTLARPGQTVGAQTCSVQAVVADVLAGVPRGTCGLANVTVAGPGEAIAAISPQSLHQIVLNLLLNACRAAGPSGSVRVMWSVEVAVMLTIEDNGPGVPHELAPLLFRPFATKSGYGTGLGLAICDRLARQAGGSVTLERAGGPGATFVVCVPRGIQAAAA